MIPVVQPTAIDLFAGAGGMTLGFEAAGFDVVGAVEVDTVHAATHRQNFPDCTVLNQDARKVSARDLRQQTRLGAAELTVVVGGPPCQGFSSIGRQASGDTRNTLVSEYARLVLELQPRFFLFENVRGLGFRQHAPLVAAFVENLSGSYDVQGPVLVDAADWGVPQRRRRVFIVGRRIDVAILDGLLPPAPTLSPPTVWDAIADLAVMDDIDTLTTSDVYFGTLPPAQSDYARTLRMPRRSNCPACSDLQVDGLSGCKRSVHQPGTAERFATTKQGARETVSRFDRLDPAGVAPTLRAGTGSDRGSYTAARPIHPYSPRCVTVREAARLQSFPDWFRFNPTTWHGFRQIGNSVPPKLAEAFAGHLSSTAAPSRMRMSQSDPTEGA